MLVLDELHQGRKYYRKKISTTNNTLDKGVLIAKYLLSIGMSRYEIEAELHKKLKAVYLRIVDENELRKKIKYMIDTAEKNPPPNTTITFNQSELDFINNQEEENIRILLITMMGIYKFHRGEFKATQMDIQKLSHIRINSAEFHRLFTRFMEMGFFNSYIKLEQKFEAKRYNGYFQPSDEILSLTKNGEYVVLINHFANLWIRNRQILGYDYNYYTCKDCGCIDIATNKRGKQRVICPDCKYEFDKKIEEEWKKKTNWKHPHRTDSGADFYYVSKPKKKSKEKK